ncbi:MAG: acetyl-CoA carboxylase carboxyltransferase subunit alpha [Gammaproteobacteria bacterium RIFCSPHIGHO2_02_FULL_42_13]|nr:MAG: acetyl-CoA carboxylase carboxyltransferase subunit alpha [Gammaproteobacteria bacterium RIFCSPHIGHO2_02_FULL_42_13]OGT67938.1 MAG: acetyl-CoA carboxylase carboxyltransferase subunit alpha [Gammaproteobacteria bacterium RIFCSPLOWO2_02_FULL_42_9]
MNLDFLTFEQPIAELQAKIEELRNLQTTNSTSFDMTNEIAKLEQRCEQLTQSIFADLKPMQVVQIARHPQRPYVLDYIERIFTDFDELQGDRHYGKGSAIVGGLARLEGESMVILGHQKGRKTTEKVARNFGMPCPEGYRKALRIMQLAEKFKLPLLTFIDTPGAYPGIDAEEHNQSEAIARNLQVMSQLKTPIICTVTGEGGSGGALAIGVGDCIMMLQYSVYSVISPEGCASILWKNSKKAAEAAEALGLTAVDLSRLRLIDHVLREPLGGAHRDVDDMAVRLKQALKEQLKILQAKPIDQLLKERYQKLMAY